MYTAILRYVPNHPERLSAIFHALGDPTRRAVLERLALGPAAVSDLARPFSMALPSFTQHLTVLEGSGLVRSRKHGRVRTYELRPLALTEVDTWLARQRTLWEKRLNQLDDYLLTLKQATTKENNKP